MSLKFEKVNYKRRNKVVFNELDFNLESKKVMTVLCDSNENYKRFLNLIIGKDNINTGSIYLDEENVTAVYRKRRNIKYVSPYSSPLWGIIPVKIRLTQRLLLSATFLNEALSKYYNDKYIADEISLANTDLHKKSLLKKINKLISEYVDNAFKIKEEWLNNYDNQIDIFHQKWVKELLVNLPEFDRQKVFTYIMKKEKIKNERSKLIFLQALWDNIYYLYKIDYSCDCEFIAKRKKLKKKPYCYFETKLVSKKFLKLLTTKLLYQRTLIYKKRKEIKKYEWRFRYEAKLKKDQKSTINSIVNGKIKNNAQLELWLKLTDDQWFEFNKKQEHLITSILPDEASMLKGKIIEYTHRYHLLVFNKQNKQQDEKIYEQEFQAVKLNSSSFLSNIYNQAYKKVNNLMEKLCIKMGWFKLTKNLSGFDQIKIAIINAIFGRNKLIILGNIYDNLTLKEKNELDIIIRKVLEHYDMSILIFSKKVDATIDITDEYLMINSFNSKKISKQHLQYNPHNIELYKMLYSSTKNIFYVNYDDKNNEVVWNDVKLACIINNKEKKNQPLMLAINPLFLSTEKTKNFNKDLNIVWKGNVKSIKKQKNGSVIEFVTQNDLQLVLKLTTYDDKVNIKKINKIYLDRQALLLYESEGNKLLKVW